MGNHFDLRYPIGTFSAPESITPEQLLAWVDDIEALPRHLRQAVNNLIPAQIDTPYRPEGWTVRQLVHHVADSHMNAYIRFKLTLTESNPTIKPYEEGLWAELSDSKMDIEPSLVILEHVHARWATILRGMSADDFERTYFHPESKKTFTLAEATGMYSWHSRHHVAHVEKLREREGW